MRMQRIERVVIADAHPLERLGMTSVVRSVFHYDKLEFASGRLELEQLLEQPTDLALIDLDLPGFAACDIHRIRSRFPATQIVVVSSESTPNKVLSVLACGVHGFIPKSLEHSQLVNALQQVASGSIYVPQALSQISSGSPAAEPGLTRQLSLRQQQVLTLAGQGRSNKEIGRMLDISEATVKVHISAAFKSMGVNNRVRAIALFNRLSDPQGLLPLATEASFRAEAARPD